MLEHLLPECFQSSRYVYNGFSLMFTIYFMSDNEFEIEKIMWWVEGWGG